MPHNLLIPEDNGFYFVDCYERLRASRIGESDVLDGGLGLSVFFHRGMFAWLQCLSSVEWGQRKEIQQSPVVPQRKHVLAIPQRNEMIAILTQLAFSQQPQEPGEVYA
jgi:hypothetical protein